jgi:hypothetical protein
MLVETMTIKINMEIKSVLLLSVTGSWGETAQ